MSLFFLPVDQKCFHGYPRHCTKTERRTWLLWHGKWGGTLPHTGPVRPHHSGLDTCKWQLGVFAHRYYTPHSVTLQGEQDSKTQVDWSKQSGESMRHEKMRAARRFTWRLCVCYRLTPHRRPSCPVWTSTHTARTRWCCRRPSPSCAHPSSTSEWKTLDSTSFSHCFFLSN